ACDYRLNLILQNAGFELSPNVLLDEQFDGMSAEEIFSWREAQNEPPKPPAPQPQESDDTKESDDDDSDEPQSCQDDESQEEQDSDKSDENGNDGPELGQEDDSGPDGSGEEDSDDQQDGENGSGEGDASGGEDAGENEGDGSADGQGDGSNDEAKYPMQDSPTGDFEDGPEPGEDGDEDEWDLAARTAERQASKAGQMPGALAEALQESREPGVDWVAITRQFVDNNIQTRSSFHTPNRRYMAAFDMILPGPCKEHVGTLVIFVDTSGSTYHLREQ